METKKYGIITSILYVILGYVLAGVLSTLTLFIPMVAGLINPTFVSIYYPLVMCFILTIYYGWLKNKERFSSKIIYVNIIYTFVVCIGFTVVFVISNASLLNPLLNVGLVLAFPFLPIYIILSLFLNTYGIIITIGITLIFSSIMLLIITKKFKLLSSQAISILCAICCFVTYFNSPNYKYKNQGHDFEFLNGYSSTDLSDYTPYSDSGKLATLDHEPAFMIENVNEMPILDGAEACYPVYSAVAKAIYKDIDKIEKRYASDEMNENGQIVTFYNTAIGFERLLNGDVDMFFGAKPSKSQLELAEEMGVELVYTPIGKEAFVFFVNEDNPIDSLSSDQIKSIYHGDITNWKELGGKDEKIIAFQRPERSGSQSMMVYFMGDVSLKEPLTVEMEYGMLGIIQEVAEYHNEAGAIGYSFRYFFEELTKVDGTKMISVNDVYPSNESIQNGEYPVVATLYCITVKDNKNENVQKVIDFLLSEDGQYLIEETGYSPLY